MCGIDDHAFRHVYEMYWNKVYRYAERFFDDNQIAEDIVQQVFVSLWERRESLQIEHAEPYLIRAVKYACLTEVKRRSRFTDTDQLPANYQISTTATDEKILQRDLEKTIDKLLMPMAENSQKMFRMRFEDGMDNQSIASYFQLSEKTIRNKLSAITRIIREKLKMEGYK